DLFATDRGLEGEVELLQQLDGREAGGAHRGLQPAVVAQADLGAEQPFDGFAGGQAAAVDVGENLVHRLERAGEPQVGQHRADVIASSACGAAHRTASA